MKNISEREAFAIAVPRRPAVLCVKGPNGVTDMIMTEWFNWLNLKRQPMLSYAMNRGASLGVGLDTDDELFLAFPPVKTALCYRAGFRTAAQGQEKPLPEGVEPCAVPGIPVLVPAGTEAILRCTLFGAYNYPFKKTRIFNCNLERAYALKEGDTRRPLSDAKGETNDDTGSD